MEFSLSPMTNGSLIFFKRTVAPVVVNHPADNDCPWLLSLERLPDKKKSWADIRMECSAAKGEADVALKPLREGIGKLVEMVQSRPR